MAMLDNTAFLLAHIHNSFITSDDTGMCELILGTDDAQTRRRVSSEKRAASWHYNRLDDSHSSIGDSGLESDTELAHSLDILPDMDFESHRRRSNTAQRLDKLMRDKHKQCKIKHVQWHPTAQQAGSRGDECDGCFDKKTLATSARHKPGQSTLSLQLQQAASTPANPFKAYFKFDGKATSGLSTKKLSIFLTMVAPEDRAYPMCVITLASAKVKDLIGLICWQYTSENHSPPLRAMVDAYALHIAEDDGQVDVDFPALDNREPISKFGFAKLALVQRELAAVPNTKVITINLPGRGFSKIPLDNTAIPLSDILNKVLRRRKLKQRKGLQYTLEKQSEPGVPVDLTSQLNSLDTTVFCLVRQNSVRGCDEDMQELAPPSVCDMAESLSSHQYKSYVVDLVHKLWPNTQVQLGISGEKIEIDPVAGKSVLLRQKAVTYDTDSIALCSILEQKRAGRCALRLIYRVVGHEYRHHDFECGTEQAKTIVKKVMNILEMRSSPARKDYATQRERKIQRRHTLSF